jgi:hypothetical protein
MSSMHEMCVVDCQCRVRSCATGMTGVPLQRLGDSSLSPNGCARSSLSPGLSWTGPVVTSFECAGALARVDPCATDRFCSQA